MKWPSQELCKKTSMFYGLSWPLEELLILPTGPTELTTQVLSIKFCEQGMHTNTWLETGQQISIWTLSHLSLVCCGTFCEKQKKTKFLSVKSIKCTKIVTHLAHISAFQNQAKKPLTGNKKLP